MVALAPRPDSELVPSPGAVLQWRCRRLQRKGQSDHQTGVWVPHLRGTGSRFVSRTWRPARTKTHPQILLDEASLGKRRYRLRLLRHGARPLRRQRVAHVDAVASESCRRSPRRATRMAGKAVIVRIPATGRELDQNIWMVKQVLDAGAHGIIFPTVETPEQALMAIRAMRFTRRARWVQPDQEPAGLRGTNPRRIWLPGDLPMNTGVKVGLRRRGYSATKRLIGATVRSCELLPRLRSVEDRRPSHGSARACLVGEVRWRPSAVQSGFPPCGGARPGPFTRRGGGDFGRWPPMRSAAEGRGARGRRVQGRATARRSAEAGRGRVGGRSARCWRAPAGCRHRGGCGCRRTPCG